MAGRGRVGVLGPALRGPGPLLPRRQRDVLPGHGLRRARPRPGPVAAVAPRGRRRRAVPPRLPGPPAPAGRGGRARDPRPLAAAARARRHGGDFRARPAARHLSGRGCFRRGLLRALGPDARLGPLSRVSRGGVGAPGDRALPRPRRGAERPPRGAPRAGAGGPGVDARRRGGAGDGPLRDRPPGALARSSRRALGRVGRAPGGLPRRPRPPRSGGTPPRHLAGRGLPSRGEPRILGAPARAARGGAAALPREPARILRCRVLGPALLPERLAVRPEPLPRPGRAPAGLPRRRRRAEAVAPRGPGRSAGARGARAGRAPDGGPPGHAAPPGQALRPDEPRGRAAGRAGARPRPGGARPPPLPGLRPGPPPPGGRPRGPPRAGRRLGRVSPS